MWEPFVTAFLLVLVTEIGDKSRLVGLLLTAKYRAPLSIFSGMTLAYVLLEGVAVLLGARLAPLLPLTLIRVAAGLLFIFFGLLLLAGKNRGQTDFDRWMDRFEFGGPFGIAFLLTALGELGDRTQIATAMMAATYETPLAVFSGVIGALTLLNLVTVSLGDAFLSRLPRRRLLAASGILFIAFGLVLLLGL